MRCIALSVFSFVVFLSSSLRGENAASDYNLLFIAMTNTRADHLGPYGYARKTSPNIDRFAEQSLVFRDIYSHASWTLPAAISLFTSQYPFSHGLLNREKFTSLPPTTPTFVEVLKENGYATRAFVGNRDYSPSYGHTSRFDQTTEAVMKGDTEDWKTYGVFENTVPPAREWLRANKDKKFCLLVQGYDTHCPFAAPRENNQFDPGYRGRIDFKRCYWTFAPTKPIRKRMDSGDYVEIFPLKTQPTAGSDFEVMFYPEDVRHMVALYDGEIFNADAWVGKLLDDVAELGLAEKTIVVIYSDHGDMFGKHGRFMRGGPLRGTFYDDVLHIPLIVRHPKIPAAAVEGIGQIIDIAPTLLDLLGLKSPASFRGKSLRPLIEKTGTPNTEVFAGAAFTPSPDNRFFRNESIIVAARNRQWKLIVERLVLPEGPADTFELYDLTKDPQELLSVADRQPADLNAMKEKLRAWLKSIDAEKVMPGL